MGHPDFQDYAEWWGSALVVEDTLALVGDVPTLIDELVPTNFRSLLIAVFPWTQPVDIQLRSFLHETITTFSPDQRATVRAGWGALWNVPALASVSAEFFLTAATPGTAVDTTVIPNNAPAYAIQAGFDGVLAHTIGNAIGSGLSETIDLPFYAGRATVHFVATAGPQVLIIQALDRNAAVQAWVHGEAHAAGTYDFEIILPPRRCQAQITNNSGGATTYDLSIVGDPLLR